MTNVKKIIIFQLVLFVLFITAWAGEVQDVVKKGDVIIKIRKLSDRVLVLTEVSPFTNNIVAISSKKGLVVVDTSGSITTAAAVREIIEKTFKRKDFAYVINTHHHWDHAFGNQVFADVKRVGHERCIEALKPGAFNIERNIAFMKRGMNANKEKLNGLDPESDEAKKLQNRVNFTSRNIKTLEQLVPHAPDIAFKNHLTLDLGDMTVKLVYFGRAHSGGDILIHVPEEGILMTGDLFLDINWLPLFAGQTELDVPMWIEALHLVLDGKSPVKHVIPGHKDLWTREKLVLWRDYIVKHWQGVKAAEAEGLDLEAILARFPLEEKYLYLKKLGHGDQRIKNFHARNIRAFLRQGKKSAALEVEQIIAKAGIEAAVKTYHKRKAGPPNEYYFDERQFNALGYRLLTGNKIKQAIEVFKLNVAAYPDSWNVYDSLAEAYMRGKNNKLAIKYYKKSVELNPDNTGGKEALKKLGYKTH
jgi:glyoxylase-like metal-dependent hydrolase (beta-lactamase superfamily II)